MFGGSTAASLKSESAIDDTSSGGDTAAPSAGRAGRAGSGSGTGSGAGAGTRKSSSRTSPSPPESDADKPPSPVAAAAASTSSSSGSGTTSATSSSPPTGSHRKRTSSRASSLLASAKNSLSLGRTGGGGSGSSGGGGGDGASSSAQTPLQKLGKQDAALAVPQGQHNNSAGESLPGPRSTFRVGVWEDRNKKCRRTMEDTHAFLYNFLRTPAPGAVPARASSDGRGSAPPSPSSSSNNSSSSDVRGIGSGMGDADDVGEALETDNGYFAIFDGHAGTFAADWCGKKLHLILEDTIRKNPHTPIPELLDQTFTSVDAQLEKLPLKNSGCTAAIAVLRWEDRVPSSQSATGSQGLGVAVAAAAAKEVEGADGSADAASRKADDAMAAAVESAHAKLKPDAQRQRVLYTANVGDARIILCRAGKALRLSYDHKGSDEHEGRRIANAGGLIVNNRVNGVLAVTRALGDTYIKDLVTGHPYTTETVIQPDADEFLILACDGLWDVCSDEEAVALVRTIADPVTAAKTLVDHALAHFSTDNLSCMIVRFDKAGADSDSGGSDSDGSGIGSGRIGVEGDEGEGEGAAAGTKLSEADRIVRSTRQRIAEGVAPAIGVSASNSGRGHDAVPPPAESAAAFQRTAIAGSVEEEPERA